MNQKMDKKDLEFILYISLGTLTGLNGLVAALFITYKANYKKYGKMIAGFLIGWLIYAIFIGPYLTFIGNLVYIFIVDIIAVGMAYIIKKDRLKNE